MRISDWSSDVCSSDLGDPAGAAEPLGQPDPGGQDRRRRHGERHRRRRRPRHQRRDGRGSLTLRWGQGLAGARPAGARRDERMFYDTRTGDHGLPHDPFKACVVPRPIGWITSMNEAGRVNLATYSFFTGGAGNPPDRQSVVKGKEGYVSVDNGGWQKQKK